MLAKVVITGSDQLNYEDLVEDAQEVFNDLVFPFLGRPPVRVQSRLVKQNTRPLHDVVENYDELLPFVDHPLTRQEYPARSSPILRPVVHVA